MSDLDPAQQCDFCKNGRVIAHSCLRSGVSWDRVSGQPALTRPLSQAVAIRACLWREVVPRQRGKGLTRSRV